MKPEQPHDNPTPRSADADQRAAGEEVSVLLDAVERDVATGKPFRDAIRDRLGLVFPAPVPNTEQVPVEPELIRAYAKEHCLPRSVTVSTD